MLNWLLRQNKSIASNFVAIEPRTRNIPLTKGQVAFVDDADYAEVSKHKWYAHPGYNTFYAARRYRATDGKRKFQYLHQFILKDVEKGLDIDHIDGNGLNNSRTNLNPCSRSENIYKSNRRPKNVMARCLEFRNKKHVFPWMKAFVVSCLLLALFGCGHQLGTVGVTGAPNVTVSLDPSSVAAYYTRYCCEVAANNGLVPVPTPSPTPNNTAIDACVAAPPTAVQDCANNETANLLAAISNSAGAIQ